MQGRLFIFTNFAYTLRRPFLIVKRTVEDACPYKCAGAMVYL